MSFGNAGVSQSGCDVNKTMTWPAPGAILTISSEEIFGSSISQMTLG